jgi:nitroreductase
MPTLPLTPDELLTTTRSVRKRLDLTRDVPIDLVRECLEIALQAPSGSNRQDWHWMVITDENSRRVIGNYYRQAVASYLKSSGSAATLFADDQERNAVQRRVGDSVAYLGEHMGEVPVLVIPCVRAPRLSAGSQAGLWGSPLPGGMELHACRPRPRIGHRLDDATSAPRNGNLRASRDASRHPARRPHPDRLLHRRHLPAGTASAAGRRAPHQLLVTTPTCQSLSTL